jgi:hypothetical protein
LNVVHCIHVIYSLIKEGGGEEEREGEENEPVKEV